MGDYVIKVAVFSGSSITMQSNARITVTRPFTTPPDVLLDCPGLQVGVYGNCNNIGIRQKTIIYLPGFNPLDFADFELSNGGGNIIINSFTRSVDEIYTEMLQNNQIIQLKNQGYRFLVVRWKNSGIDIRFNALYLMHLIERLKQQQMETADVFDQFVVIGESLGGLIGRYALTYMESEQYNSGNYGNFFISSLLTNNSYYTATHLGDLWAATQFRFRPDMRHNTRLFMTFDTPHQGANVPLSLQLGYKSILSLVGSFLNISELTTRLNIGLEAMAAKQMLIYHADTKDFANNYYSHPYKNTFFNELQGMGNYPKFAKVVALSNGSLAGHGQINGYTGNERMPEDRLIDIHVGTYAKVLWFLKIPLFGADATLNTNPNGSGLLMQANAGRYWFKIKLKWFGIKIFFGFNSLFNVTERCNNVTPYCVNSGGYVGSIPAPVQRIEDGHDVSNSDLLNVFSWHTVNDGMGCHTLRSHVGWNGFASLNLEYSFCSDGFNFCLVPTQSALDYGTLGSIPLNHDIEHEDINVKLSQVPASVIIGYPEAQRQQIPRSTFTSFNFHHLRYRNPVIDNIRQSTTQFFSCENSNEVISRTMLSQEIGDEELYLENCNLPWMADYWAEYDLHINARNPRYEYPSQPFINNNNMLRGAYSKQDDFVLTNNGFARLFYDRAGSPTGIGLNMQKPIPHPSRLSLQDGPQFTCCRDFFVAKRKLELPIATTNFGTNSYLKIYPNPSSAANMLNLQYLFAQNSKVKMQIFDVMGKLYCTKEWLGDIGFTENKRSFDIGNLHLSKGIYFIKLSSAKEVLHQQLIINQ
jgi:Secretion system C-terminal sorting domain